MSKLKTEHYSNRLTVESKYLLTVVNDLASSGHGHSTIYPVHRNYLPINSFKVYCEDLVHLLDKSPYNGYIKHSPSDDNLCMITIVEAKLDNPASQPDSSTDSRIPSEIKHLFSWN